MTATAFDVAAYILSKSGPMSHMKLQKLLYYSQAWSLVWDDRPMFNDRIEAWVNGPVVRRVYAQLRERFIVSKENLGIHCDQEKLDDVAKETVNRVLAFYGPHDSQWLSDLTHMEQPWRDARRDLLPTDRGETEITHASMAEYYGSL